VVVSSLLDPEKRPDFIDDVKETYAEMRDEHYASLQVGRSRRSAPPTCPPGAGAGRLCPAGGSDVQRTQGSAARCLARCGFWAVGGA
jgi:hypothetical protein